jgi:hypothetical protein
VTHSTAPAPIGTAHTMPSLKPAALTPNA